MVFRGFSPPSQEVPRDPKGLLFPVVLLSLEALYVSKMLKSCKNLFFSTGLGGLDGVFKCFFHINYWQSIEMIYE